MKDAQLGILEQDEHVPNMLNGMVRYCSRDVKLTINPDGGALDDCLLLARQGVDDLERIDSLAKRAACQDLLTTYNEHWREYQESDGKGGWDIVSNKVLSEADFTSKVSLTTVQAEGNDSLCLWYDDGGLFAGHGIMVTSSDGSKYCNLDVTLWG